MTDRPTYINISIILDHPYFHLKGDVKVPSLFNLQDSISEIDSTVLRESNRFVYKSTDEYDSFATSIEDLIEDYYHLDLTYFIKGNDYDRSNQYVIKDTNGHILFYIRLRLKKITDPQHETSDSLDITTLYSMFSPSEFDMQYPCVKEIRVKDKVFLQDIDAYEYVDSIIHDIVGEPETNFK